MTIEVWYQLFIGDEKRGRVTTVSFEGDTVDKLAKAIHSERSIELQPLGPAYLEVYPAGTDWPIPDGTEALDPRRKISSLNLEEDDTLLVVAPKKEEPRDAYGESVLLLLIVQYSASRILLVCSGFLVFARSG